MASRIGKKEDLQPTNFFNQFLIGFERILVRFIEWYGLQLNWVLNHKLIFTSIVLLLFAMTMGVMKQGIIGKELISTGDQGKFRFALEFDKSTSIRRNDSVSGEIEKYFLAHSEVKSLFSNVGGPSTGIGSLGVGASYKTEFTVQLKDKKELNHLRTEDFMLRIRQDVQKKYPNIRFSMASLGLVPRSAPIEMTLSGSSQEKVMQAARLLKEIVQRIPGTDNVQLSVEEGSPEYQVLPDKDRMQRLGLNTAYAGQNLRIAFSGNDDASLTETGTEYPVRIWLADFDRRNYEDVSRLTILNPVGIPVQVAQFAQVVEGRTPSLLERKDRQPAVTITSDALGRPSGTVADEVVAYLNENPLPDGISLAWGSDIKRQNDSFGALGSVLAISFLLIYLIMVALYDSFIYPFVALFSIPVAGIGAFLALNLSLSNLSLFALLGLIMLMGLVTKNAILIVDFTNQLKAEGLHYREALIQAGKERMRPILMTTIAMAIGMLPIALAKGTASEWKNGLAWVIIGGLISSLILTVYLVPMVYYLVDRIRERFKAKKGAI
jgi:HAE1 family hydrophobic/amphiphilic exporter-1